MRPDDKQCDMRVALKYTAEVEFPFPSKVKKAMEDGPHGEMVVAMLSNEGKTSLRTPEDTRDQAVHEYRRIHNLPPIPYPNASRIQGRKSTNLEAYYEVYGKMDLPSSAVVRAQAGAAPIFAIRLTKDDNDKGIVKARVSGTSPAAGNAEFVRAEISRAQQIPQPAPSTPTGAPIQPSTFKTRDGDYSNYKGGRRGGGRGTQQF